ncbi:MAG TPA: HlyD family secretion protein [Xanthomonadales bacterium]|nr:HlyD family secretion protein [Xanthomonadales bacterium]
MNEPQDPKQPAELPGQVPSTKPQKPQADEQTTADKAVQHGTQGLLLLIVLCLTWYLFADRYSPYSSQARVQAFVVPVAPEVAGRIAQVLVKNDQLVEAGQPLFELDDSQYQIALAKARSDYETTLNSINAATAGVTSAEANLRVAQASLLKAAQDASRQEKLYQEDPGAISVRRLEVARATLEESHGRVAAAEAQVAQAREQEGGPLETNAKLLSARQAVEKAELDMKNVMLLSPSAGLVTDLRTDVGHFAAAGAPLLTLITVHNLWISADMTENNLSVMQPGNRVDILLDALPGKVFKGKVRSIGRGVSSGQSAQGGLPTIQNDGDWLRQSQRFPVAIEFEPQSLQELLPSARMGGQADVVIYTGDHSILNFLSHVYIRLMSWLSFAY